MSWRRRTIMALATERAVVVDMGLDTRIELVLDGSTLVVDGGYGGVGTHNDLARNYPDLYFGAPKCYADGKIWDLTQPLPLGFRSAGIREVQLLASGRTGVTIGKSSLNWIAWTPTSVTVSDGSGSSSRYCIKIIFD